MPSIVNPDASLTYQVQSQSTEFAYNAEAQRIGKTVSVTSTVNGQTQTDTASLRHYNNGTAIVADGVTRGTTTELNSYIFGKESEPGYAQFEALYDGTTLYFAEVDSHTDVTELVGANGQTASYSYDAYGNATSAISGGVYNSYRYTSQYLDEETGLYYLRARYYDPSNGRFTQEDSYLGEENSPLTLNLYMYCHGNPLMFRDLSGNASYRNSITAMRFRRKIMKYSVTTIISTFWTTLNYKYEISTTGIIRFSFENNDYWSLVWRQSTKTLAEAMYKAAKSINKKFLSGRTISGIHVETMLHWAAYTLHIKRSSSKVADMGARWKGTTGYDSNAWVFETLNYYGLQAKLVIPGSIQGVVRDIMRYL